VPETGEIWVAARAGGFWVLELEPRFREFLGLPAVPTRSPNGPPAHGLESVDLTGARAELSTSYCTLGRL